MNEIRNILWALKAIASGGRMSLDEALDTDRREEILYILLDAGSGVKSRMQYRRDRLKEFFKENSMDVEFQMSDLKRLAQEYEDYKPKKSVPAKTAPIEIKIDEVLKALIEEVGEEDLRQAFKFPPMHPTDWYETIVDVLEKEYGFERKLNKAILDYLD